MSKNNNTQDSVDEFVSEEAKVEYNIIKYALSFLIANIDEDILEDMSDFLHVYSVEELESYIQETIDNY
jgi:predicted component of type VI protein secretion system